MNGYSFEIKTAQNVTLNYDIAGIGERVVAAIVDLAIVMGYELTIFFSISVGVQFSEYVWLLIFLSIPGLFYHLLFEIFLHGQSPGKKLMKIKVVRIDGSEASMGDYLIRWIFRLSDINFTFGSLGTILIILNNKGQRLGDILAKTTVIRVRNRVALKDTLYEKLNSDYKPVYQEVKKLNSEDIELIKKVLNSREYLDNFDLVYKLTNKIQSKMDVFRTEGPEDFLKTVVKDYNYLCDE
jgi:uncharacterized RDD family membrane protein YckC